MVNKGGEIRRILMGNIEQREDGTLAATQPGQRAIFRGFRNGYGSVRFFGVGKKITWYIVKGEDPLAQIQEVFSDIGRKITLKALPEAACCYYCSPMGNPVLLTAEQQEEALVLTLYAGRTPLAPLRRKLVLGKVEKRLSDDFARLDKQEQKEQRKKVRREEKEQASGPKKKKRRWNFRRKEEDGR